MIEVAVGAGSLQVTFAVKRVGLPLQSYVHWSKEFWLDQSQDTISDSPLL